MKLGTFIAVMLFACSAMLGYQTASADETKLGIALDADDLSTVRGLGKTPTATALHGLPGNNPANGGNSANPNGVGADGNANVNGGIHNIGGGAPGIVGLHPVRDGHDPAGTMHGGLNATTGRSTPAVLQ